MIELIFLTLYRFVSGLQNGLGYSQNDFQPLATVALILSTLALGVYAWFIPLSILLKVVATLLALASAASALMVQLSFRPIPDLPIFDVHFWETLTTAFVTLAWIFLGGNILLIVASVYPGLILHKAMVNVFTGNPFFYQGTNDPTGRTFDLPVLGVVVFRGSNQWRLMLTLFSLILVAMTLLNGWVVSIHPFRIDLFGA